MMIRGMMQAPVDPCVVYPVESRLRSQKAVVSQPLKFQDRGRDLCRRHRDSDLVIWYIIKVLQ